MRKAPYLAFSELERALTNHSELNSFKHLRDLPSKAPLFVTWTKNDRLRGCIGTFSPLPLAEGIRKYALIAALDDSRFKPISAKELPDLTVSVTILGPLEPITDPLDWTLGLHGVKAVFPGNESSTFLPDVATEQGWSKERTLEELAIKAGVEGAKPIKVYRYEGTKEKLTYEEFKELQRSQDFS